MKRSKHYRDAAEKIDPERLYAPLDAVRLARDTSSTPLSRTRIRPRPPRPSRSRGSVRPDRYISPRC